MASRLAWKVCLLSIVEEYDANYMTDIEKLLVSVDAIKINDVRLKNNAKKENGNDGSRSIRAGDKINQDDDEDWD